MSEAAPINMIYGCMRIGVSNMPGYEREFLERSTGIRLGISQMGMSLGNLQWLDDLVDFNTEAATVVGAAAAVREAMAAGVQLQAWAPLAGGRGLGTQHQEDPLAKHLQLLADQHGTSREAVALAFLLRHPAGIRPVVGTTNTERLGRCVDAWGIRLNQADWCSL